MTQDGSFKDEHLFCLKSTGLGLSEMFLRLMAFGFNNLTGNNSLSYHKINYSTL